MKEMECVIGTFRHVEGLWKKRAKRMGEERLGHKAYAAREMDRWGRWAGVAKTEFANVTGMRVFQQ